MRISPDQITLQVLSTYEFIARCDSSDLALEIRRSGSRWLVLPSDSLTRRQRLIVSACFAIAVARDGYRNQFDDFSEAIDGAVEIFSIAEFTDPALLETLGAACDEGDRRRTPDLIAAHHAHLASSWRASADPRYPSSMRACESRALDYETEAARVARPKKKSDLRRLLS